MSFKPLLNHLEINFWQSTINLMHASTPVRFAIPRIYRLYQTLTDINSTFRAVMWLFSGLAIGFALGALKALIW